MTRIMLVILFVLAAFISACDNDSNGYKGECPKGQSWVSRTLKSDDGGPDVVYQACE
jgi:hypothetical protein